MSKVKASVFSALLVVLCGVIYYFTLPAISLASVGFWFFLILCLSCVSVIVMLFTYEKYTKPTRISWIIVGCVAALLLILGIASTNMFHANQAYSVADVTVSENGIEEAFPDISKAENLKNLPLVDLDTARMLGDKKIAKLENASWYDVSDGYNLIKYQGKYYRLSAINYGGFFKYNKAKAKGLPGYVLVEVTPENGAITQEANLVELDSPIRYSTSAYWGYDLKRHLRGQYPNYMFRGCFLEIDEEGVPYWVIGVVRPTAGVFGVKTITSFILMNAQTGESKEYDVSDAPEWIDHIYPLNYLMDVAYWHYAYADGFWNNAFSKTNVLRTSYYYRDKRDDKDEDEESEANKFANFFGYSSIVGKDGEVMFYTGLTAANNAESNLGWLTIDISTGKMTQYEVIGAEESSAQAAVEQLVQANRYEATFPLPVNIGGHESYIMCLKGKAGLTQAFAICNVDNYSIAVQSETIDGAIGSYLAKFNDDPEKLIQACLDISRGDESATNNDLGMNDPDISKSDANEPKGEIFSKTGVAKQIYSASINGTTYYYYLIDENLYRASILINQAQVTYVNGDTIDLTYYANDRGGYYEVVSLK